MTKLNENTQWDSETHIFKCWCGEHSFLEVSGDPEDGEIYITITMNPSTLLERLKDAWKAIRGLEFSASNCIMLDPADVSKLTEALSTYNKKVS